MLSSSTLPAVPDVLPEYPVIRKGVGIVVIHPTRPMLLTGVRSADARRPSVEQLPQGGIDMAADVKPAMQLNCPPDTSWAQRIARVTAMRELDEETGLTARQVRFLGILPQNTRYLLDRPRTKDGVTIHGQEHTWVMLLAADSALPDPTQVREQEFSALYWRTPADVLKLCDQRRVPTYMEVFRMMETFLFQRKDRRFTDDWRRCA